MKKFLSVLSFLFVYTTSFAEAPEAMNYQAVARDISGNILANQNVCIRSAITDGNGGPLLYSETFSTVTNQFGLFTLKIGMGTPVTGTFDAIDWTGAEAWQAIEMDVACTGSYTSMGNSQLLSVPYAKRADAVNIYAGGTNNASKMVITHSPQYQNYGLQYEDSVDKFHFLSGGNDVLTIDVSARKRVGIGTSSPVSKLDVRGSQSAGTDTGLVTVENTGTGNTIHALGAGTNISTGAVIRAEHTNGGTAFVGVTSGSGWPFYGYNVGGTAAYMVGDIVTTADTRTSGYTQLGTGAPNIKMKKITGTTAATEGGTVTIPHGVTFSQIIGVQVMVDNGTAILPPNLTIFLGLEFQYYFNSTNLVVRNVASNSSSILSMPFTAIIIYEQ
jgi:hypothetical protein